MPKLILFDLDGVLIDATELHYEALNQALEKNSQEIISRDLHESKFNGLPTKTKLKMLGLSDYLIKKVNDDKQEITIQLIDKHIKFDNEKFQMMEELNKFHILGVVTNSIRHSTVKMLSNAGIYHFVEDLIITNEDVINPKPSSEPYIKAIIQAGKITNYSLFYPKDVIIVEDSEIGYKSAVGTGVKVIKVNGYKDVNLDLFKKEGVIK